MIEVICHADPGMVIPTVEEARGKFSPPVRFSSGDPAFVAVVPTVRILRDGILIKMFEGTAEIVAGLIAFLNLLIPINPAEMR